MRLNDTWESRQATIRAARKKLDADERRRQERRDETRRQAKADQRALDKINARKRGK